MVSPEDLRQCRAAEGWLELNLPQEAAHELKSLSEEAQCDPLAIVLWMHVHYALAQWEQCLESATKLIRDAAAKAHPYVSGSIALYRLHRTQDAWDFLRPVLDKFRDDWSVPYNLACYAAQLGRLEDALEMFNLASKRGDAAKIKAHGLKDPDLEPIWPMIGAG